MKSISKAILVSAVVAGALAAGSAQAGTLENLERERALLVETMLTPSLTSEERQSKLAVRQAPAGRSRTHGPARSVPGR